MKKILFFAFLIALIGFGYLAFGSKPSQGQASAGMNAAVPVKVRTLRLQKAQIWSNFSGKLVAVDSVEVRPQVGGKIKEIRFQDGASVKQGDILFVIEPEFYEAALERAQGALASAQTQAALADRELKRAQGLIKAGAVTKQLLDERANNKRVAEAAVKSALADLKQAKINLDYAFVKAPISGRVSRAEITEGNLVQTGAGAPVLTRIVSNAGIYADFEVDTQSYLQAVGQGNTDTQSQMQIPVIVTLKDDRAGRAFEGHIQAFDNQIDPATGTIRARAFFDNAEGLLIPGMFASVRMGTLNAQECLVVPETVLGTDQDRKFVYVVEDSKVAYRPVTLGPSTQDGRVIVSGLKEGDRVIVEGLQHVRPDVPVTATEEPAPATPVQADQGVSRIENISAVPNEAAQTAKTDEPANEEKK